MERIAQPISVRPATAVERPTEDPDQEAGERHRKAGQGGAGRAAGRLQYEPRESDEREGAADLRDRIGSELGQQRQTTGAAGIGGRAHTFLSIHDNGITIEQHNKFAGRHRSIRRCMWLSTRFS
jgi:hypothetical protein